MSIFKFTTSTFVAGVGETYLTQSLPFSVNSFGGKIEFKKSSDLQVDVTDADLDKDFCEALLLVLADTDTSIGVSYLTSDS